MNITYRKEYAIEVAKLFLEEVQELEKKYAMNFNSDTGDIYLSFRLELNAEKKVWDTISLGWDGDGTQLKVIEEEKQKEILKQQALEKLTPEEKEALGL